MAINDNLTKTDAKKVMSRIALKIDTWENWQKDAAKSLVLHAGEIAFVQMGTVPPIGDNNGTTEVLFKVGDGTTTFEKLPWGSAKAADVYDWAKVSSANIVEISYGSGENEKKSTLSAFLQAFETYKTSNDQAISGINGALETLSGKVNSLEGLVGGDANFATKDDVSKAVSDAKEELTGESTVAGVVSTIKEASAQAIAAQTTADEAKIWINTNKTNLEKVAGDPVTKNEVTQAISTHNTNVKHITVDEMNTAISAADAALETKLKGTSSSETVATTIAGASDKAEEAATAANAANIVATRAEGKVDILIGTATDDQGNKIDAGKSVRTIANEELAAQLLSGNADADFKTLQELAAWLEDHPEDAAEFNRLLNGLGTKEVNDPNSDDPDKKITISKTVAEHVADAVSAEATLRAEAITTAIQGLAITKITVGPGKTVKEITETDGIVNVTTQDIAITKSQITDFAHKHDEDYAAKTPTDEHIANTNIHVTKDQKDSWDAAAPKAESAIQGVKVNGTELTPDEARKVDVTIVSGTDNGTIKVNGSDVAVTGLGSAAYTDATAYASSTDFSDHVTKAVTTQTYLLIDCGSSTVNVD